MRHGAKELLERTAVYDRFKEFKAGNESLPDKPRSGRSREVDRQAVLDRIEECPSLSSRMLGNEFDCDQKTILTILYETGLDSEGDYFDY
ncbi:hypothetical protein KIN20_029401 [Parelaphostrongylus tenuis]|uniref:Uncharacterized protein n=1 Tax=Parelaphostrongylus tenuis TaxID=148309 RepID=A0AAD5R2G3_PARTN|nr:hypothetical protein KIN20_029401 [Parelaphostrongylus tenuis]